METNNEAITKPKVQLPQELNNAMFNIVTICKNSKLSWEEHMQLQKDIELINNTLLSNREQELRKITQKDN